MEKIIDRIRKLLSLAGSSNANEAALAAAEAARLMQEHQIEEASLSVAESAPREPVGEQPIDGHRPGDRRPAPWKAHVGCGVAVSLGCRLWFRGNATMIIGRPSDVRIIAETYAYLVDELEAMADRAWAEERVRGGYVNLPGAFIAGQARTWKTSFLAGAAHAIRARMEAERAQVQAEYKARAEAERKQAEALRQICGGTLPESVPAESTALVPISTALARLGEVQAQVDAVFNAHGFRKSGTRGRCTVSSGSAYAQGKRAGINMSLRPENRRLGAR